MDLSVEFGDLWTLKVPIMNASGPLCTTKDQLDTLVRYDPTGAVISKSCTGQFRAGNCFPRYYDDGGSDGCVPLYSINSTGLANQGWKYYRDYGLSLERVSRISKEEEKKDDKEENKEEEEEEDKENEEEDKEEDKENEEEEEEEEEDKEDDYLKKPYLISVAGLSLEENLEILRGLTEIENNKKCCDAIELNLSCPNVVGKPQIGYDFEASRELLRRVFEQGLNGYPLGLKLPPYFDLVHYDLMTSVIKDFPISYLTCVNSLGNGLVVDIDTEATVIAPKGGFGGIGGNVIKPFALANVRRFRQLLPEMPIFGCGGVKSGRDVFEHLLVGADAVQIGSQLMIEGVGCFWRIQMELEGLMKEKGYRQISDFQGKLKALEGS